MTDTGASFIGTELAKSLPTAHFIQNLGSLCLLNKAGEDFPGEY